jgi:rhodanese-related sulfurtransferase
MKRCFLSLIILSIVLCASAQTPEQTRDDRITVKELKQKMDRKEDIVIIDARSGNSYLGSSVKIKGAIHITLDDLESRMGDLPKDKEIVAYCT